MTAIDVGTMTEANLLATAWMLRRFTQGGSVTDVAFDQWVLVQFEASGAVIVEAGLLTGSGRHVMSGDELRLSQLSFTEHTGCLGADSLELRVAAALSAPFAVECDAGRLLLRSDDAVLHFVAR